MVIILVFLTLLVAISIEVLKQRKARKIDEPIALAEARHDVSPTVINFSPRRNHLIFPKGFYYHNGHA